jgi:S1-C subfamily serine protease
MTNLGPNSDPNPNQTPHVLVKPPKPANLAKTSENNTIIKPNSTHIHNNNPSPIQNKSWFNWRFLVLALMILIIIGLASGLAVLNSNLKDVSKRLAELSSQQNVQERNLNEVEAQAANLGKNPNLQKALKSVVRIERRIGADDVKRIRSSLGPRLSQTERGKLTSSSEAKEFWELAGTGVVVDKDLILTNKHVIGLNYDYRAIDANNQLIDVVRAAVHPTEDLGLLKASQRTDLEPINIADKIDTGDQIFALGHPLGLTNTLSQGLVSSINRNFLYESDSYLSYIRLPQALRDASIRTPENDKQGLIFRYQDQGFSHMLQHNAAINFGSSGGPIVNSQGQMVAVNTFGIRRADTRTFNMNPGVDPEQDINNYKDLENKVSEGYAPSSDFAQNGGIYRDVVVSFLAAYQNKTELPFLDGFGAAVTPSQAGFWGLPASYGFWLQGLTDSYYGIKEPGVTPNGNLAKSGLVNGDLITNLGGQELNNKSIGHVLSGLKPEQEVSVVYYRQKEDKSWVKQEGKLVVSKIKVWSDQDLRAMKLGSLQL